MLSQVWSTQLEVLGIRRYPPDCAIRSAVVTHICEYFVSPMKRRGISSVNCTSMSPGAASQKLHFCEALETSPVHRTPEYAGRAQVTRLSSLKLLEKELSLHHAMSVSLAWALSPALLLLSKAWLLTCFPSSLAQWRTLSARSLERQMERQAKVQMAAFHSSLAVPGMCGKGGDVVLEGGRAPSKADPKQGPPTAPSGKERDLAAHRELLAVLQREGPLTEGILRRAVSGAAVQELHEALDCGLDFDLGSFLRSIPSKFLVNDLSEMWISAMQKTSMEEKMEQEPLAVLQREGPLTEGIFRRAVSGEAVQELHEALDCGLDFDLGSQSVDLLAIVLKDFLRSIPSKFLVNNLYEDWTAAMKNSSMDKKMEDLKA
ncbi:hypothetical protein Q9966_014395 [Columba livia]|nr:hypothetical protein Q9966_014395 [Columba livia]